MVVAKYFFVAHSFICFPIEWRQFVIMRHAAIEPRADINPGLAGSTPQLDEMTDRYCGKGQVLGT